MVYLVWLKRNKINFKIAHLLRLKFEFLRSNFSKIVRKQPIPEKVNTSVIKIIYLVKKNLLYYKNSTGWNDKIVVLKKTTLQLYFKTFIEKINSGNLIM